MLQLRWQFEHTQILDSAFDWEISASSTAQGAGGAEASPADTQARHIGDFDMTLKLRGQPGHQYTSRAFEPKHFKISIEQGIFRSPNRAGREVQDLLRASGWEDYPGSWDRGLLPEDESPKWRWRYAYRLVFDKSPYPPEEEWVQPLQGRMRGMHGSHPEIMVEFVTQTLPESEFGKPAMNAAWQREMVRVWEEREHADIGRNRRAELHREHLARRSRMRFLPRKGTH
jgi:hypothetical protein